jgi:hypothetical protein
MALPFPGVNQNCAELRSLRSERYHAEVVLFVPCCPKPNVLTEIRSHIILVANRPSRGSSATNLPLLPGRLQLPVSRRLDLLLTPASMSFGVM